MKEYQQNIPLFPWITASKGSNKTTPLQFRVDHRQSTSKEAVLITILSLRPETLSLLGKFTLTCEEGSTEPLAYLSPVLQVKETSFQIAFVPFRESKPEYECLQSVSDILKSVSEIVVTDVNCNGPHKYKERRLCESGEGRQFVIVSNKDVYQIDLKEGKIELSKKVQFSLSRDTWVMPEISPTPKTVRLDLIGTAFLEYTRQFAWFLNSDKNWKTLADLVLVRYRSEIHVNECFALEQGRPTKKMFTFKEMAIIQSQIMSNANGQTGGMAQWVALAVAQKLGKSNNNVPQLLLALREQYSQRSVENQEQLAQLSEEAREVLLDYQIPQEFVSFLLPTHEQHLLSLQNQHLHQKQQILKQLVMQRNNQLMLKAHKIDQLKDMLREFTDKAEEMKHNTQQLIEITQLYDQEKQKNWKLQLEVDSHLFIAKKNAQNKLDLENEIQTLLKEKGDLLLGLQELTSENLSLMNERSTLQQEISDLRDRIEDSNQVEARALKSIQNQAEIKVRLSRYQNYVQQLKQVFNSFKRLEIEKFNYVLQHNYKQYEQLQERLKFMQFELRRSQGRVKEVTESLHCERVKLAYFERMYASNYQNETIPEVSEENSATDREVTQNA